MNSFKGAYQDDLAHAFFDEEEFAERHTVDGVECTVILTDVTSVIATPVSAKYAINPKETAINKASYVIDIRDTDVEKLKRTKFTSGAMINLDGKKYFVQDVKHSNGMYRLTIGIHAV
ncbi:MAG: hypothetical protein NC417_08990 [Candidatus Gastranaerophilales bacterium]|nr:hypothetical protein [Candidatus Gastranaerophilales bacterium]